MRGIWHDLDAAACNVSGSHGGNALQEAFDPQVSSNHGGNALAVWRQSVTPDNTVFNVFGAYYDACTGQWSGRTNLSRMTPGHEGSTSGSATVVLGDCCRGAAVWKQAVGVDPTTETIIYNIFTSVYDVSSSTWMPPINITLDPSSGADAPTIALGSDCNAFVAYDKQSIIDTPVTANVHISGTATVSVTLDGSAVVECDSVPVSAHGTATVTFDGNVVVNNELVKHFSIVGTKDIDPLGDGLEAYYGCTSISSFFDVFFDISLTQSIAVDDRVPFVVVSFDVTGTLAAVVTDVNTTASVSCTQPLTGVVDVGATYGGSGFFEISGQGNYATDIVMGPPDPCPNHVSLTASVVIPPMPTFMCSPVAGPYNMCTTPPTVGPLMPLDIRTLPCTADTAPQVAVDACGNGVVTWVGHCDALAGSTTSSQPREKRRLDATSDTFSCILARAYNANAGIWLDTTNLTNGMSFSGANPQIALSLCGQGAIAWQQTTSGGYHDIYASACSTNPFGYGFPVLVSDGVSDAINPRVAATCNGSVIIAWHELVGSISTIRARTLSADGQTLGPIMDVSHCPTANDTLVRIVTLDAKDNALAVWNREGAGGVGSSSAIFASSYDTACALWTAPLNISRATLASQGPNAGNPSLSSDCRGDAIAVWQALNEQNISNIFSRYYKGIVVPSSPLQANTFFLLDRHERYGCINAVAWFNQECGCSCAPLAAVGGDCTCGDDIVVYKLEGERLVPLTSIHRGNSTTSLSWCTVSGIPYLAASGTPDENGNEITVFKLENTTGTFKLVPVATWKHGAAVNCLSWLCSCAPCAGSSRILAFGGAAERRGGQAEVCVLFFDPCVTLMPLTLGAQFVNGAPVRTIDWCGGRPCSNDPLLLAIGGDPITHGSDKGLNIRIVMFNDSGIAALTGVHDESNRVNAVRWCCAGQESSPRLLAVGGSSAPGTSSTRVYQFIPRTNRLSLVARPHSSPQNFTVLSIDVASGTEALCDQSCLTACAFITTGGGFAPEEHTRLCKPNLFVYHRQKEHEGKKRLFDLTRIAKESVAQTIRSLAWCTPVGESYGYLLVASTLQHDDETDEPHGRACITLYKANMSAECHDNVPPCRKTTRKKPAHRRRS